MNKVHSLIIDYPIDYNIYPLSKNEKMFKVELNKNDYLIIPRFWFHWVFTDPNTISINYEITYIDFTSQKNQFCDSFEFNNPYKGYQDIVDIKYDDFITSSLNQDYTAIISENEDCSPVIKNNFSKYYHYNTLSNIISNNPNNHVYIGRNAIYKENILFPLSDINNIMNNNEYNEIYYKSAVWFTLDKTINSGLHNDSTHNIIYLLDGKKTIYLFHPDSKENLYIRTMPSIK